MPYWPNGLGSSLGDELLTQSPTITSSNVYFVHYTNGNDSDAGTPENPKKTLQAGVTAAGVSGIVVLQDGHDEVLAATVALAAEAYITIVGEGRTDGKPGAKLRAPAAGTECIDIQVPGVMVRNIYFPESTVANNTGKVRVRGSGGLVRGCYFESNGFDTDGALVVEDGPGGPAAFNTIEDCTFESTSEDRADLPHSGLRIQDATGGLRLKNVTFDNGLYGYTIAALTLSDLMVGFGGDGVTFTNGADAVLGDAVGDVTGWMYLLGNAGSARVRFPA